MGYLVDELCFVPLAPFGGPRAPFGRPLGPFARPGAHAEFLENSYDYRREGLNIHDITYGYSRDWLKFHEITYAFRKG